MSEGFLLSEADLKVVKWVVSNLRHRFHNTLNRPAIPHESGTTPDVLLARSPSAGISALVAGSSFAEDVPGKAECKVYRILEQGKYGEDTEPTLSQVGVSSKLIYNMDAEPVPGDHWLLVSKLKSGQWVIDQVYGAGSAETGTGTGTSTAVSAGTGTGTATSSTSTGTGTSNNTCPGIPGVDITAIPIVEDPDYILAVKDGCLVLVRVGNCDDTTGTAS